jgi:outer membrane protein TolC
MKILLSLAGIFSLAIVQGQDTITPYLSAEGFLNIVKQYHPVVRQADISIESAKARQLAARGMFDPSITSNSSKKTFDGVHYYNAVDPVLQIPTWYGIEVYAGTGYLAGERLDPTETAGRTSFAGVSVPLAKNLLMDKRRAVLKTAGIFRSLSLIEKRSVINDLMLDASIAYWEWVRNYELYRLASDAVVVNEKRLALVGTTVNLGERAAIDTVETLAQLQSFRYLQNDALIQFLNSGVNLGVFLWKPNGEPYTMPRDVIPAAGQLDINYAEQPEGMFSSFIDSALTQHPKLKEYDEKLKALEINRRLAFQELLPTINLKYNQLGKGYDIIKTAGAFLSENNYRFGMSFSLPLRLSQGRGEYKLAKLKINETVVEQDLTRLLIINKVTTAFNELINTKKQIALQEEVYKNFLRLQQAEETRYFNGESSLFLINSRETKAIEARQKLLEVKAKYFVTEAKLKNAAGLL